jgi:hypothetical protein
MLSNATPTLSGRSERHIRSGIQPFGRQLEQQQLERRRHVGGVRHLLLAPRENCR